MLVQIRAATMKLTIVLRHSHNAFLPEMVQRGMGFVAFAIAVVLALSAMLWMLISVSSGEKALRRSLQILSLAITLTFFIQSSMVLPSSYDLASSLGFGARTSGLIIGSGFAANAIGAILQVQCLTKPWIQSRNRWAIVLAALGSVFLHLLFIVSVYATWSSRLRLAVIIVARAGLGLLQP